MAFFFFKPQQRACDRHQGKHNSRPPLSVARCNMVTLSSSKPQHVSSHTPSALIQPTIVCLGRHCMQTGFGFHVSRAGLVCLSALLESKRGVFSLTLLETLRTKKKREKEKRKKKTTTKKDGSLHDKSADCRLFLWTIAKWLHCLLKPRLCREGGKLVTVTFSLEPAKHAFNVSWELLQYCVR